MARPHASSAPRSELAQSDARARDPGARRVRVLLPLPLAGPYDYLAVGRERGSTGAERVEPGDFVRVPLGGRVVAGCVWDDRVQSPVDPRNAIDDSRLKSVIEKFPAPPMPEIHRRFVDWVADYTLTPPGAVLKMALGGGAALESETLPTGYRRRQGNPPVGIKITAARGRVLELAGEGSARPAVELARAAAVGPGVVRGLVEAGLLEEISMPPPPPFALPDWRRPGAILSPAQEAAASELRARATEDAASVTLLEGVTGAGKTEVYFEAIAAALARGRQALVLLPEIALTSQWLERFRTRFGVDPAPWHSELTPAVRRRTWRAVAQGCTPVVVGARSALFLPFPALGLVVVDEEHDASYKQEDGVIYQARDMAVARGHLGKIPIVLSSATPSLETLVNVERGRYRRVALPARHGGASLPKIEVIDMRRSPPPRGRWLSPVLIDEVAATLARGEQSLLFLNRRGYAPLTLCRACGHRIECPYCSAWLVRHKAASRLICHHCGHSITVPNACASCGAKDQYVACGPGVERIGEEIADLFPAAHIEVVASDTIAGPETAQAIIRRIAAREIDILIGTQILAKGHHFPLLTTVGVVDADLGLGGGDLRAVERTYQLLTQVAGRAGRAQHPGRVLLQTLMPDHPALQALVAGDAAEWLRTERIQREAAGMPPFGRLVALIVSSAEQAAADRVARELGRSAPREHDIRVLGPAPAPFALLRGRHRRRLLLKAPRGAPVRELMRNWLARVQVPRAVRVQIDVDPQSFL